MTGRKTSAELYCSLIFISENNMYMVIGRVSVTSGMPVEEVVWTLLPGVMANFNPDKFIPTGRAVFHGAV